MAVDPLFDVPRPVVPKTQEPDFRREFWRQSPDMRPNSGRERMATVKVCRYSNGRHESPPKPWCPHFKSQDERGFRIRPEWTVQDDIDWSKVNENGTVEA